MDDEEFLRIINKKMQQEEFRWDSERIFAKEIEKFDRELKKLIQTDRFREELLKEVECCRAIDFETIFSIDDYRDRRFQYVCSGSFGNVLILYAGRRRQIQIIKTIRCLPERLSYAYRTGSMSYRDTLNEVKCLKILSKLCSGVWLTRKNFTINGDGQIDHRNVSINCDDDDDGDEDDDRLDGDVDDDGLNEISTKITTKIEINQCRNLNLFDYKPRKRFYFKANCFPKLYKVYLCQNEMKSKFCFDSLYPIDNVRPIDENLETTLIRMEHCGIELNQLIEMDRIGPEAIVSILKQIIIGIAIAESIYKFEHRDLHRSNITCSSIDREWIKFIYNSQKYYLQSYGFEAKIIDYSYSRINDGERVYFKDLSYLNYEKYDAEKSINDPDDDSDGDDNEIGPYSEMAKLFQSKNWSHYSNRTNLIWIKFLLKDLFAILETKSFRLSFNDEHRRIWNYLGKMIKTIEQCEDIFQFFNQLTSDNLNTIVPFQS
ncbi:Putative serine/threonine-protein kinase haspin -like protein [Sarcoptes scabiei]|uniref:Putative serine/threonine-protein kinase haspin -like protein n=1 Tax=Sarcoptes scabiei TaxID=52283 RepID=A0A834RF76_SARSC|nr:Putative serine/threonine-protein kinase haspin -like protein [Sarcoptes scabiei]